MLTINDLIIQRDGRAIHPALSLVLNKGEAWWLKGPNGSGKSSLLKAILGWLPHQGIPLETDCRVAYLGHQIGLPQHLTVWEHCAFHPAVEQFDSVTCDALLGELGLQPLKRRYIGSLSAGQKQRLAFVPLILSGALLWLLDEPFTALDSEGTAKAKSLLKKYCGQGVGMLIVSHDDLSDWATHTLCMGVPDDA